jgi:NAD+ synthase (glutamine-hydrolysing)
MLKLILAQINLTVGDIDGNVNAIIKTAQRARDVYAAHVVAFPELAITGYSPEDLLLRFDVLNSVEQALQYLLYAVPDIAIILGYPRRYGAAVYNCAGVIYQGRLVAEYHKQALPNYGVFDERRYFNAGECPCVVTLQGLNVGITVCEDVWFSEPIFNTHAAGAQLIVNINASPFHVGKHSEREAQVRQRVMEVHIPILYLNLVGGQDELVFDGNSFVMDATGQITHRASHCVEEEIVVNLDIAGIESGTIALTPSNEMAVYQALVLGVRDFVWKNGFHGAILGLSGGIDSALTLAIAVDALGADQVEAVLMPSRYTANMSNEDAIAQANALKVIWHKISIEPPLQTFVTEISTAMNIELTGITQENIQARCRGLIMMALSNQTGKILLSTGNKSEVAVGYTTLYGDMAGGFAPLKDVFKTFVYKLARYRNTLQPIIPNRVLQRPPSAELRPNQTDQDSLPPYEMLDTILHLYIELDKSIAEIVTAGFDLTTVQRVINLVNHSEHKRHQAPPGVRITQRAFGKDRRYPIVNKFYATT